MNEEQLKQLIIVEEEVRPFIRLPACGDCAKKDHKVILQETEGQILMGPQEMPMVVWSCPECDYTINLPPGAFPQSGFQVVRLEGPPPPKGDSGQN